MIVITGGAGFIGSCILARLNLMGWTEIMVVDEGEEQEAKRANLKNKQFKQYLDKKIFLQRIVEDKVDSKIEILVHMGACSSTTGTDAHYYNENNFEYTRILAEWCLKKGVRFIYASSAATYGAGEQGYKDDEATCRRLKPLNIYGESKQKFDLWVLDHHLQDKMVGLKFFNVFGPNEYHKGEMRSVIAKAYDKVATEGKIALFKSYRPDYQDGEQKRDFIYVKDAVDIVLFFMEHSEINGIFNVGTGQARTWNDLARALFSAVGKKTNIEYIEMPVALRDKYQYFTEAEMSKLRASGYSQPFTSLENAVKDYVGYLKKGSHF